MLIFSQPSLSMRIAKLITSLVPVNFREEKTDRLWADVMTRDKPRHARPPLWLRVKHQISYCLINNQEVFEVSNPGNASDYHIVYFHGGGYINPMHPAHWLIIGSLIKHTKTDITIPTYPLAPEYNYRDAMAHIEASYRNTLAMHPGKKIVLCGDSAGGGLALALTLICREKHLPMPHKLVLFAPWLDITLADSGIGDIEPNDIMLGVNGLRKAGSMWAAGDNPHTPLLSPLHADLHGFPPMAIFQGTADIFICDARAFATKAEKEDVPLQLFEYEGAFHVYMFATFTPEAQDTFQRVGQMLR